MFFRPRRSGTLRAEGCRRKAQPIAANRLGQVEGLHRLPVAVQPVRRDVRLGSRS